MRDSEIITRGDLPHWYKPGHAHFVTYRIFDSIPPSLLTQWKQERIHQTNQRLPSGVSLSEQRERAHKMYFKRYDAFLDARADVRWLAESAIAEIVRGNLYHHHDSLYQLLAWCVMPNHVHIVIQPYELTASFCSSDAGSIDHVEDAASILLQQDAIHSDEVSDTVSPLSRIMHSLKSYVANQANTHLNREGRFWQRESYDHWVRESR